LNDASSAVLSYQASLKLDMNEAKTHGYMGHQIYQVFVSLTPVDKNNKMYDMKRTMSYNQITEVMTGDGEFVQAQMLDFESLERIMSKYKECKQAQSAICDLNFQDLLFLEEAATFHLEKAIESNCLVPVIYLDRGALLYETGRGQQLNPRRAVDYFRAALEASRQAIARNEVNIALEEAALLNMIALSLASAGEQMAAEEEFKSAVIRFPRDFALHTNLAGLLNDVGKQDEAYMHYKVALEIAPNSAELLNNLGFFAETSGKLDEALQYYMRASALLPDHPVLSTNLNNMKKRMVIE
jgi:tetratricopeptide (TPR) repeat protein